MNSIRLSVFKNVLYLFLLIFYWACGSAYAQGNHPIYRLYNYKDFNATDEYQWGIAQDSRGLLFFAHNDGLMLFDGASWTTLPTAKLVRAVAVDEKNRIYVGGKGDFGYLVPSAAGYSLNYRSAKALLPEKERVHLEVEHIYTTGQTVYYVSTHAVAIGTWAGGTDMKLKYIATDGEIIGSGLVGANLYINVAGKGLVKMTNTGQQGRVAAPADFALDDCYIRMFAPLPDGKSYLIGTAFYGLYKLWPDGSIRKFTTQADGLLTDRILYHGTVSADGMIALAFQSDGVLILNPDGTLRNTLSQSSGFPNDETYFVFSDRERGLWISTSVGVVYTLPELPVSSYAAVPGLSGKIHAIEEMRGTVYVATNNALYYADIEQPSSYQAIGQDETECWDLLQMDGRMLAATSAGVYDITDGRATLLLEEYTTGLFASENTRGLLFAATKNGLYTLRHQGGGVYGTARAVPGSQEELNSVVELKDGSLWLGSTFRGLIKLEGYQKAQPTLTRLAGKYGLPDGFVRVSSIQNRLVLATDEGIFTKTEKGFEKDALLNQLSSGGLANLDPAGPDALWLYSALGIYKIRVRDGRFAVDSVSVAYMFDEKASSIYSSAGNTWLAFQDKLIRINNKRTVSTKKERFSPLIRLVTAGRDSVLYQGYYWNDQGEISLSQTDRFMQRLDYGLNSMVFFIGATSYINPQANRYQYRLEGLDKEWSAWVSGGSAIRYPNLSEGSYTFLVRARNAFGEISEVERYSFTIRPPWYRSIYAYIAYVLLAAALIFGLLRLNAARLQRRNRKLEALVNRRTEELRKEKELVEQQHNIIEKKNEDILASFVYAQRIQHAFMPEPDTLARHFKDNMLVFMPRDIVSGDFYWWVEYQDKFVLAAVDCTGHGVPGAFMSIIGSTFLSQIVEGEHTLNPADILNKLDQRIRVALGQDKPDSKTADGMDLAILVFDHARTRVQFAAAQRPLFLYRQGELSEYAGSKVFLGSKNYGNNTIEGHEIALQPGDRLYIFSDGMPDQFGGEKSRKFSLQRIREIITQSANLPLQQQQQQLEAALAQWKGEQEQTDDIVFIGVEV
jgi:serine phosphatase RsbU (regulator of sigma subunit)